MPRMAQRIDSSLVKSGAGPEAAGSWTGIQNAVGNLGGVLSPLLTGLIVARTGSYYLAFATASGVLALGAASYLMLIGEIAPLRWKRETVTQVF